MSINVEEIRAIARDAAYGTSAEFKPGDLIEPEIQRHLLSISCIDVKKHCRAQLEFKLKSSMETEFRVKKDGICVNRHKHESIYVFVAEDGASEVKGPNRGYSEEMVDCYDEEADA